MPIPELMVPSPAAFDPAPYQPTDPPPTMAEHRAPAQRSLNVGSILWGTCLICAGGFWFVASLANGRASSSAVVLFVIGLIRVFSAFQR